MSDWKLIRCDLCETPIGRVLKDSVVDLGPRSIRVQQPVVCLDCYEKTKPGAKK